MARNRSTNRRRRRGRFGFLLKTVCILLVIAAIVAALTLFFKVEEIRVDGNARYNSDEVIAASGIAIEDNLFLMNKFAVATDIFEKLPYVEEATIQRKLPDTILISVTECSAVAGISSPDGYWLVSHTGKMLELAAAVPEGSPIVTGVVPENPTLSAQLTFGEEQESKVTALLNLLNAASARGMLAGIESIELGDDTAIYFSYIDRFTVKLPWDSDMDYKLQSLAAVADYLEVNETGEINLMTQGKASFIPTT